MPHSASQMSFDFPEPPVGLSQLAISASNRSVLRIIQTPQNWPNTVVCITGPASCGISTMLEAWCQAFGAHCFNAADFSRKAGKNIQDLAAAYVAIDDADLLKDSDLLLSLINTMADAGGRLLLGAHVAPPQWQSVSADLKSRLNAMTLAEIDPPDESMLRLRLEHAAKRRFLQLDDSILKYLANRLDLSYEIVEKFIENLSDTVTESQRPPTIPMVKKVLAHMGMGTADQPPLF